MTQNGYNFSIKVPYCAHNGSRTNFPSQGHLSLWKSAIFAKIQPKIAIFDFFSCRSETSQRKSHAIYPLTVKWLIIHFSLTNFATSKKSKIQPFLSLKFSQNIKKPTRISFDPDSQHVGLPPNANHCSRKMGSNLWSWAKNRSQTYKNKGP